MVEVTGSNPVWPTNKTEAPRKRSLSAGFFCNSTSQFYLCKGWCKKARDKRHLVGFVVSRVKYWLTSKASNPVWPTNKTEAPRKRSLSAGFFCNSTSQFYLCKGWCKKARDKRQLVGFVVFRVKYWLTSKASNPVWPTKNKPNHEEGFYFQYNFSGGFSLSSFTF